LADWQTLELYLFLEQIHGGGQIQIFFPRKKGVIYAADTLGRIRNVLAIPK